MKLPNLQLSAASKEHSERLARWLSEWELDRDLTAGDKSLPYQLTLRLYDQNKTVDSAESPIRGQIRLFHPDLFPADARPVFFTVLDIRRDLCLAVPFGRFSEPGLPGELLTNRDTPCLRVLCLWNFMLISIKTATRSWVADMLTLEELQDARSAFTRRNDTLSEDLAARMGPPCWHPSDPRQQYKSQESSLLQPLQTASGKWTAEYPEIGSRLDIAAEDRDDWSPGSN